MRVSKSSRSSPTSSSRAALSRARQQAVLDLPAVALLLAVWIGAVAWWFHRSGFTLFYGDAEAHLNVARRFFDSRHPGYDQVGTTWLPLPHALLAPFAQRDEWWHSGVAGIFAPAAAFVLAGVFLYALLRRWFDSRTAAAAGVAVFALNPNLLYLSSIPMTESLFFACLFGTLAALARLRDRPDSTFAVLGASLCAAGGSLTRYDGWFLLPFFAAAVLLYGGWRKAVLFCVLAGLGPLYWLAHNFYYYGDALEFARGQYSSQAINPNVAGYHDWSKGWQFFRAAAELCAGTPLLWLGVAGCGAALARRAWLLLLILLAPPFFYVWSIYTGNVPIHVPQLWYGSYYNTRYGLAALPLFVAGGAALIASLPERMRSAAAIAAVLIVSLPWIFYPRMETWITWKESQVNSEDRRAWTREAAQFFRDHYRGGGVFVNFGDLSGVWRQAGIPLRETLYDGNQPAYDAAIARPELFLHEEWVVAFAGDRTATAAERVGRNGGRSYRLVRAIMAGKSPVIHIYRRD